MSWNYHTSRVSLNLTCQLWQVHPINIRRKHLRLPVVNPHLQTLLFIHPMAMLGTVFSLTIAMNTFTCYSHPCLLRWVTFESYNRLVTHSLTNFFPKRYNARIGWLGVSRITWGFRETNLPSVTRRGHLNACDNQIGSSSTLEIWITSIIDLEVECGIDRTPRSFGCTSVSHELTKARTETVIMHLKR